MPWRVDTADYAGEGYWQDYPPFEFETEQQATSFADTIRANAQLGGHSKVRRVYEVDDKGKYLRVLDE